MATAEEISAILTPFARSIDIGRMATLSSWVLLIWDHAIHFDKELELFWLKPWSAAKGLYFFNRYAALIFVGVHAMVFLSPYVTDTVCLWWFKFEGYTGLAGIAAVELVLGFRVLALWNKNKWIVGFVGFAFFAEIGAMLGILTATYTHMDAISQIFPSVPYRACLPLNVSSYFFAFWLPPLGYEFAVFLLASAKGWETMKLTFKNFTFRSTGSRLLEVMIRDSLWYFLLIITCDLTCALIWLKGPDSLLQAVVGYGLVIPSVAASHLLLNLRDAYYHPTGETTIGRSEYTRTNIGDLPTFNRGKDIMASGGRHKVVGELDTSWALDSSADDKSFILRAQDVPGLPTVPGSTSTFCETAHAKTIQYSDDSNTDINTAGAPNQPTPSILVFAPKSSSGLRRPSLPTDGDSSVALNTGPFAERETDSRREEDAYELDEVAVYPHSPIHSSPGPARSPPPAV